MFGASIKTRLTRVRDETEKQTVKKHRRSLKHANGTDVFPTTADRFNETRGTVSLRLAGRYGKFDLTADPGRDI